jgi:hypothetical protein
MASSDVVVGLARDTTILMGDHTIKTVQEIKIGDCILNHLYNKCVIEYVACHNKCRDLYEISYSNGCIYVTAAQQKIALIHDHKIVHMTAEQFYTLPLYIQSTYKGIYKTIAGYQPITISINKKEGNEDCYELKAASSTYALRGEDHVILCL